MDVLRLLLGLLPASRLKNRLLDVSARRWRVARTATVKPCILWRITVLSIEEGAFIGIGNVFRNMRRVSIGVGAEIHQLNEFTGTAKWADQRDPDLAGALVLGEKAAITGRHFFECSGGVSIGRLSVIGGFKSMVITRFIDLETVRQTGNPVRIGEHCMIASGVIIIPGMTIGDRCVVGAGSVVAKDLLTPETIYAGNPAKPIGSAEGAAFLHRCEQRALPRDVVDALIRHSR
ncbi:MAG: acyltransferase [Pseudonocardia sp.]